MKTRLISITKPVIEGIESAEDLISYCARVSNPSNQFNNETSEKLIKYLINRTCHVSNNQQISVI